MHIIDPLGVKIYIYYLVTFDDLPLTGDENIGKTLIKQKLVKHVQPVNNYFLTCIFKTNGRSVVYYLHVRAMKPPF